MTRTRRTAATVVLLAAVLMLTGCEGKVVKREFVGHDKYKIVYKRDDGTERVEIVNKAVFDACKVGRKWPDCRDGIHNGMRNLPAPEDGHGNSDEDLRRAQRADDERRRREERGDPPGHGERDEDCDRNIQVVVGYYPDGFVRVEWTLEDRNGSDRGRRVIHSGGFSRSRVMCPGGLAKIKATTVGVDPDTMHCIIREDGIPVKGRAPTKIGRCGETYIVR